jgi:DNA-binding transcriptional LysR family regulator
MQPYESCEPCPHFPKGFKWARLDELGVLVEVAESGSLSAAARKLGVPKSTVGRAIGRIEEDLGVSLVRRMAKGPTLTEPGRLLADMAAPHITALRDASAALGRAASEAYGLLRITTIADIGSLVLAPLLPGFLARYPRVRPEIVLALRTVDLVGEGFDVGIRVTLRKSLPSSSLIAKKIGPINVGLYASTQYAARRELPKQPCDLLEHDNVVFFPGDANDYHMNGPKGAVRVKVPGRVSGDDFFFIREAVVAGVGIGAMPWFMASHELAAGRVVRVLPDYLAMNGAIYLVYPPTKPLPPKVAAFTTFLREHAPRLLGPSQ